MLPLRFTFSSDAIKSRESNSQDEKSPVSHVNSPNVAQVESWSQRYSTPIYLMLTAVVGFVSGYNVGRYSKSV